ncbi:MAG: hypothetical protein ACLVJO_16870 [[Clostridium] scindens]
MDLEHEKRLAEVEQRAKSNTHRLDELEPIVGEIHKMSETLVEMTVEMKHTNKNVEDIKNKVECIKESQRASGKIHKGFVNAFLGAIGTAVAGGMIYLLTMIQ